MKIKLTTIVLLIAAAAVVWFVFFSDEKRENKTVSKSDPHSRKFETKNDPYDLEPDGMGGIIDYYR